MITAIIISLIGVILLAIGASHRMQFQKVSKIGKRAEGVVFETETEDLEFGAGSQHSRQPSRYPIIRFTTEKEEWITEKYTAVVIPGLLKVGSRVNVIYNPDKPTEFVLDSKGVNFVLNALVIAGLALVVVGVGGYLLYPDFFNMSWQP